MSAGSAAASPVPAASSTSPRTPGRWSSPAPSPPVACGSRRPTAALRIAQEGRSRKFVAAVEQVTFNGGLAAAAGQRVLYVTERCVFRLTAAGLALVEVAPGIDLERDILALMDFRPLVNDPKPMDARLFRAAAMGLEAMLLDRPLGRSVHPRSGPLDAVHRLRRLPGAAPGAGRGGARAGRARWSAPLGRKVEAVIDYDGCTIDPAVAEAWFDMARDVQARFYDKAVALHDQRLHAAQARRRAAAARDGAARVRVGAGTALARGPLPSDAAARELSRPVLGRLSSAGLLGMGAARRRSARWSACTA